MFHAFCLVCSDKSVREKKAVDFLKQFNLNNVDIASFKDDSFTMLNARDLIRFLSLSPFASPQKAAVITSAVITPEAQQALLKTFEEPPPNSILILTTPTLDSLLPTLISRCQIIVFRQETKRNDINFSDISSFWRDILKANLGERLKQATILAKDKDALIDWMDSQIRYLYENLPTAFTPESQMFPKEHAFLLKRLEKTRKLIIVNVSHKLALDHFFISLPLRNY